METENKAKSDLQNSDFTRKLTHCSKDLDVIHPNGSKIRNEEEAQKYTSNEVIEAGKEASNQPFRNRVGQLHSVLKEQRS